MPNLQHLDVTLWWELIDGHQWESIIRNFLPKLKIFRLKMRKVIEFDENLEQQADDLINSFQSSFWIDEHQWFVERLIVSRILRLFTLSNPFHYYDYISHSWESTRPNDDYQKVYDNLTSITDDQCFNKQIRSDICFPNISVLRIKLPINDKFWSIVPNLNRLKSLIISSYTNTFQFHLQALLDQISHLDLLRISQETSLPLQISLFNYTNTSIRQLDLLDCNYCFNEEECITLSHSPLGIHCEVLVIRVKNRESIINLVKYIPNLRALNIYWNFEKYSEQLQQSENIDESRNKTTQILEHLVQWLKDHLSSTCLIVHDPHYKHDISIWI